MLSQFAQLENKLRLPDLWQQEVLKHISSGKDVVVHAPTGAGKTYIVELLAQANRKGQIVHSVPTRALANDKAREWREKDWRVGIVTGDVTVDPQAPLVVATLETQKPRFLAGKGPEVFVVDEYQMLGDQVRGINYELSIAYSPPSTRLLLLSGSVSNPEDVVDWLCRLGRDAVLVSTEERPVPLEEIYVDDIPRRTPPSVTGFWPRLLGKALMADLGPVLVFAPQRQAAEKLARQLAAAFPVENPLGLSAEQKRLAGGQLAKLLNKRIAYHHSGLSYRQRAGLIEPLAKLGQLRIVVSTTGLAAGVNFSMRSVVVTESEYTIDHVRHPIQPDELLQMFGRAGRRGLDEKGYALVVPSRPRLMEARRRAVKRPDMLDWPSLIGLMSNAALNGDDPLVVAREAAGRLFNSAAPNLGFERSMETSDAPCGFVVDAARARYARSQCQEMLNTNGDWESMGSKQKVLASRVFERKQGVLCPVLSSAERVRELGRGRLDKVGVESGFTWGKKLPIAYRNRDDENTFELAGWFRRALAEQRGLDAKGIKKRCSLEWINEISLGEITKCVGFGECWEVQDRGARVFARVKLDSVEVDAYLDSVGNGIVNPDTRMSVPELCQNCEQFEVCSSELSDRRSIALSWQQLGLIDEFGFPTRRGEVFGFFQGGEGLAIAAALEDEEYSVDAIALDIANLRAGFRFDEHSQFSHRLARACRKAYGDRSYDGYLKHGLPPAYGEGAAEVIAEMVHHPSRAKALFTDQLKAGDAERAKLEWLSLLKRISGAPDLEWERWMELKRAVDVYLELESRDDSLIEFPDLSAGQRAKVSHLLRFPH